ncbi:hypothetical protein JKG47_17815 [Acidithiobacillus sp. MC6.1]|nr:hypothetical protein [Acidithiobacillus sp. MC6.1]
MAPSRTAGSAWRSQQARVRGDGYGVTIADVCFVFNTDWELAAGCRWCAMISHTGLLLARSVETPTCRKGAKPCE